MLFFICADMRIAIRMYILCIIWVSAFVLSARLHTHTKYTGCYEWINMWRAYRQKSDNNFLGGKLWYIFFSQARLSSRRHYSRPSSGCSRFYPKDDSPLLSVSVVALSQREPSAIFFYRILSLWNMLTLFSDKRVINKALVENLQYTFLCENQLTTFYLNTMSYITIFAWLKLSCLCAV